MQRVMVFGSACCTGWAFSYEASDEMQAMIRRHAETYNSTEAWHKRNCDGTVYVFDSVDEALSKIEEEMGLEDASFENLAEMFDFFKEDGEGREVNAAWIVHMLLSDAMADEWMPPA